MENILIKKNIDVITLSSTHLPFLKLMLETLFPNITFVDPANSVAKKIQKKIKNNQEKQNKNLLFWGCEKISKKSFKTWNKKQS